MMPSTDPNHHCESQLTTLPGVEEPLPAVDSTGDDDKRRRAHLADAEILGSVRDVIRRRGVAVDKVDDELNDVIVEALEKLESVPVDREEARLYLCGMGRFKAIDDANDRRRELDHRAKVTPKDADPRSPSLDELADARGYLSALKRRFPKTHEWFLRHTLGGESHGEIGASVNRSPETVRKTIKSIQESLATADKRKISLVIVAAMLAVVFGMHRWHQISNVSWDDQLSHTAKPFKPRSDEPRVRHLNGYDDPASLRAIAKKECAIGQWDLCAQHLRRADSLDPDGQTLEIVEIEGLANQKLQSMPAKPGIK
jgi:DNA-directed RNA polymerase specialized sigma24 family protein